MGGSDVGHDEAEIPIHHWTTIVIWCWFLYSRQRPLAILTIQYTAQSHHQLFACFDWTNVPNSCWSDVVFANELCSAHTNSSSFRIRESECDYYTKKRPLLGVFVLSGHRECLVSLTILTQVCKLQFDATYIEKDISSSTYRICC